MIYFIEVVLFFCSTVTGDPFPDPRGRYKRGGGLNVPVQLTVKKTRIDAVKLKASLAKHNVNSYIDEC